MSGVEVKAEIEWFRLGEGPVSRAKRTRDAPCPQVRLSHVRTLALRKEVEHWLLTTLREKLVKNSAKVLRHGHYVTFQLAEVAVPRDLFANILLRIDRLRPKPAAA